MILMLICAVTILSIHAVRTAQKDAEKFTWREIKGTMPEVLYYDFGDYLSLDIPELDKVVREVVNDPTVNAYGMIAVVKVKKSRSVLATYKTDSEIRPAEIRSAKPKLYQLVDVLEASKTITDAEILEVLYQPHSTFYHRGQTVQLQEEYFMIDQRVPNILRTVWREFRMNGTAGPEPEEAYIVRLNDYHPLEEGEIYLVYTRIEPGRYATNPDYHMTWSVRKTNAVICLSSPELKAGNNFVSNQELQWVTEKYDLSKYLK